MPRKRDPVRAWLDMVADDVAGAVTARVNDYLDEFLPGLLRTMGPAPRGRRPAEARPPVGERPRPQGTELARAAVTLGVTETAPRPVVDAAFRAGAATAHPDRGGSPEDFRRLTSARAAYYRARGWGKP